MFHLPTAARGFSLLACLAQLGACGATPPAAAKQSKATQRLSVRGSDTMVMLVQGWAEAFRQQEPTVRIEVSGGGSGTGIAALRNGISDLATASRPMSASEKAQIEAAYPGQQVEEQVVAVDAIAVYVHTSNPLPALRLEDLRRLFLAKASSFAEVGGDRRPVVLYSRESSSGTYSYFKEHVLRKADFAAVVQTLPGTAAVIHAVRLDAHGIGYGGIAYARGVHVVPLLDARGQRVLPTAANVRRGSYPLARPLYIYRLSAGSAAGARWIDWIQSAAGQSLTQRAGAFPIGQAGS